VFTESVEEELVRVSGLEQLGIDDIKEEEKTIDASDIAQFNEWFVVALSKMTKRLREDCQTFIIQAYSKGNIRAYTDARKGKPKKADNLDWAKITDKPFSAQIPTPEVLAFQAGGKEQFLEVMRQSPSSKKTLDILLRTVNADISAIESKLIQSVSRHLLEVERQSPSSPSAGALFNSSVEKAGFLDLVKKGVEYLKKPEPETPSGQSDISVSKSGSPISKTVTKGNITISPPPPKQKRNVPEWFKKIVASVKGAVTTAGKRVVSVLQDTATGAHDEGQLDAFESLGYDEVSTVVEWQTADDDRVCPHCKDMEGAIYPIQLARGMLPLHPNCRCCWSPPIQMPKVPSDEKAKRKNETIPETTKRLEKDIATLTEERKTITPEKDKELTEE
jgi:SPP1 gp7 family putative phage head morphogenesis protein